MATYDNDEPSELELEERRAGVRPERSGELFDRLQAGSWLAGLDNIGEATGVDATETDPVDDPDAERMAEHQRNATGHPNVRFNPEDLAHPSGEEPDPAP
jgi:hypothetical protein